GILSAEAAEFLTYASLDRTQTLAVSMARRHVQFFPDGGQVFFFYAQQIYALAAGDFDHGDLVLVGYISNAAQLRGVGDAAPHARNDGIGAILLNVGMHALVHQPGL